jgi:hypothetical protein
MTHEQLQGAINHKREVNNLIVEILTKNGSSHSVLPPKPNDFNKMTGR